jgi:hypothetical protein
MIDPKGRKPEDTAEGCRIRAEEHLSEAAGELSARMRTRLESSAQAWTARADLLERLETTRHLHQS